VGAERYLKKVASYEVLKSLEKKRLSSTLKNYLLLLQKSKTVWRRLG